MFIFAFRLKLLFLRGKKNAPCICVKYSNYALHWDKRKKKKLTASKRNKNLNSFLALNMTQIVKNNIFTLEMFEVLTFCPLNCQLVFRDRASRFLAFSKLTLISSLL